MPTSLITGATSGIGHEFAVQLASRGHDLVIVARDPARLEAVAQRLRADHRVQVEVLRADLSDRAQLQTVADRVADSAHPVDLLVNNAGYGLKGRFVDNDAAVEEALFDVLARAVLVLSHAAAVRVTALCPGYVTTEFQQRAGLSTPGPGFLWLETQRLVADCLADVERGKVVSVPSLQYKAAVGLLRVVPRPLLRRQMRTLRMPGLRRSR